MRQQERQGYRFRLGFSWAAMTGAVQPVTLAAWATL
jgi:hypothetical protein